MKKFEDTVEARDVLVKALKSGIVAIEFLKANGELRKMDATLHGPLLPTYDPDEVKRAKTPNIDIQPVWDCEKAQWRSFRWDSLQSYE